VFRTIVIPLGLHNFIFYFKSFQHSWRW